MKLFLPGRGGGGGEGGEGGRGGGERAVSVFNQLQYIIFNTLRYAPLHVLK